MKRQLVASLLMTALAIPFPIAAQAPRNNRDQAIQAVVDKIIADSRNIDWAVLQTPRGAAAHLRRVAANVRALGAATNADHEMAMIGRDRLIAMGHRADVVDRVLNGGVEGVATELEGMAAQISASAAPGAPSARPAVFIPGETSFSIRRVQGIYNQAQCQSLAQQILVLTLIAAGLCAIPGGQIACLGAATNIAALQLLYIRVCP